MLIVASFITDEREEKPKCLPIDERINKMDNIYTHT